MIFATAFKWPYSQLFYVAYIRCTNSFHARSDGAEFRLVNVQLRIHKTFRPHGSNFRFWRISVLIARSQNLKSALDGQGPIIEWIVTRMGEDQAKRGLREAKAAQAVLVE